jgi:hypothetical protein
LLHAGGQRAQAVKERRLEDEFSVPGRSEQIQLKKLRSDYTEFAVYWQLAPGTDWIREYCTNRINVGAGGMPRRVCATLVSGTLGSFDDLGFPATPANIDDLGTRVLIGTGNTELAVSARKTTDAAGALDFCGGTHGHETDPTGMVVKADGVVIDYAGAANGTTWTARRFAFTYRTTLLFPSDDLTEFATVDWVQTFDQDGYSASHTFELTADAIIHNHYMLMLQTVNRSGTTDQADDVGAGMDSILPEFDFIRTFTGYNDGITDIPARRGQAAFYNGAYAVGAFCTVQSGFDADYSSSTFRTPTALSFVQDRSDGKVKYYNRLFGGNSSSGITVAAGAGYSSETRFRIAAGADFAMRFAAL